MKFLSPFVFTKLGKAGEIKEGVEFTSLKNLLQLTALLDHREEKKTQKKKKKKRKKKDLLLLQSYGPWIHDIKEKRFYLFIYIFLVYLLKRP